MRLPPPSGALARTAHGAVALAALPLRSRYLGPVPAGRLALPEVRGVPTPAGSIHTLAWGKDGGCPTVLLHGVNANARYWTGVASELLPGRWILAPDLRGHGRTGPLRGGCALEETRADLLAWMDALGLAQADLVGHSWGGKVALDLAAAAPHRIRRLALADPVPPQGLHWLIRRSRWLVGALFAAERGPFPDSGALAEVHGSISWLRHAEPWMHEAFDANFVPAPGGGWRHVLDAPRFEEIFQKVLCRPSPLPLGPVTMPVLLVLASFSVLAFPGDVSGLRRRLPQLRVVRVPGEHSLHATNPVGLARALAEFLVA